MKKDCQEAMSGYVIAVYLYNTSWGIFLFVLATTSNLKNSLTAASILLDSTAHKRLPETLCLHRCPSKGKAN